jgi:hypothetical protein
MRVFTTHPQEEQRKVGPAVQEIEAAGYTGVATISIPRSPIRWDERLDR